MRHHHPLLPLQALAVVVVTSLVLVLGYLLGRGARVVVVPPPCVERRP